MVTPGESLDRAPGDWRSLALSRVTLDRCDGPFGSGLTSAVYTDQGTRVVRLQNIGSGDFLDADKAYIDEAYYRESLGDHSVQAGDLLIAGLGDESHPAGRACVAPDNLGAAMVKADCFRFRLNRHDAIPQFLAYQLSATADAFAQANATGTTRSRVNLTRMAARRIVLPPIGRQRTVVDFLDSATRRVDALVSRKQQLIELLQENRTALISHAVTKGLNPDAPVKDTGIEWLGPIPAHWDAGVIRRAARLESGHTPSRQHPEYWEDCSVPWFTLADIWQVRPGIQEYVSETSECVSEVGIAHSSARLLPAGTVLLSRTASVGFSAIANVPLATSQDFANWVCGDALLPAYLLYVFRSMRGELMRLTMGSTHKTIYMPIIAKLAGPLPPVNEQRQIVEHIRRKSRAMDALSVRIGEAIERLHEYRSALITAAVTGQIDVRTYRARDAS